MKTKHKAQIPANVSTNKFFVKGQEGVETVRETMHMIDQESSATNLQRYVLTSEDSDE